MASNYQSITEAIDYKVLVEAIVLYGYHLKSLEAIIDDTNNKARADEYSAAYDQLLHAYQYQMNLTDAEDASNDETWKAHTSFTQHTDTIPTPEHPNVERWAVRDTTKHLQALNAAALYLEATLFTIEARSRAPQ